MVEFSHIQELELYRMIYNTLFEFGIPSHISGHDYLVSAIELVVKDPAYLRRITGRLYPDVAELYGVDARCIEHSIRTAIEKAFSCGDIDALQGYFGPLIGLKNGKTTNSEFIAVVAQRLRMELGLADNLAAR